jgi:hypothetical protein
MDTAKKQLWIGLVEVRPMNGKSETLDGAKGAFVNIVTWATDAEQFKRNAELVIRELDGALCVCEVVNPEPVETRRARDRGPFEEDMEDIISRAERNPNAIIYGTFHLFENDNA